MTLTLLVLTVDHQRMVNCHPFSGTRNTKEPITCKTNDLGPLKHHKDGSPHEGLLHFVLLLIFYMEIQVMRWSWSYF